MDSKRIGKKIGYTTVHLQKVETGVSNPSLKFIFEICKVFSIELNTFFWFVDKEITDKER